MASKKKQPYLKHGRYFFEGWSAPDPNDEKLHESMRRFRYDLKRCDQSDAYRVLAAAEAYCHFTGHPAGNNSLCSQLRVLRNAIKRISEASK